MRARKFAGSLFHGSLSDAGCLSMHSWLRHEGDRHTEIQGAGTLEGEAQPSALARWTVLTGKDAGLCWFIPGWRPSWHSHRFVTPIHTLLCSLGEKIPLPPSPPALFLAKHPSKAVDQPVKPHCAQVLATLTQTAESSNHLMFRRYF